MRILTLLIVLVTIINPSFSQKPPITYSSADSYPRIISSKISNNGKLILYVISQSNSENTLIIYSTENKIVKHILGANPFFDATFTPDNRKLLYSRNDSLFILDLKTKSQTIISNFKSFKIPDEGPIEAVACQLKTNELFIYNSDLKPIKKYDNVKDYYFSKSGNILLVHRNVKLDGPEITSINIRDLKNDIEYNIWHGTNVSNVTLNKDENQIAFIAKQNYNQNALNEIWSYRKGEKTSTLLVDSSLLENGKEWRISNSKIEFDTESDKLFFSIEKAIHPDPESNSIPYVNIWSYNDEYLLPQQTDKINNIVNKKALTAYNISTKKITTLERESDGPTNIRLNYGGDFNYLLIQKSGNLWEPNLLDPNKLTVTLVNTNDGSRKQILAGIKSQCQFSPMGKFLYWYDGEQNAYLTYNLKTGLIKNTTADIPDNDLYNNPLSIGCWAPDDKFIFLYDKYDIWKVDPTGLKPPINTTAGYGRKNKIRLRFVFQTTFAEIYSNLVKLNNSIVLCGINEQNKDNGFFLKNLNDLEAPKVLNMSPNVMYYPDNISFTTFPKFLLKAKNANAFLLTSMSYNEYPNLNLTSDFVNFEKISYLKPQASYNWLTAELVNWSTFDSTPSTGILYKPENFKPSKKYPIIFSIYEEQSAGLNNYLEPSLSDGVLNIPYFVSNGYLVFCPDIKYQIGNVAQSVYDHVVSAAKYLSKIPWVDSSNIGIHGHSFGGYEVNLLITQTSIFKAAASSAGSCDLISASGTLKGDKYDSHEYLISSQNRMGKPLWKDPENYIRHSPIFKANLVNTPLLIMHNRNDPGVPWTQSVEYFTALRYLKKKVWLLQYSNAGHTLTEPRDQLDYSIRLSQFFNYYLKGTSAPLWMSSEPGINKGVN